MVRIQVIRNTIIVVIIIQVVWNSIAIGISRLAVGYAITVRVLVFRVWEK